MKNEEEHIDVREKLHKLPRVKARDGFENELLRRINLIDAQTVKSTAKKGSIWDSLFGRKSLAWTVPAMSLGVIAIVFVGVYFAFFKSKDMQQISQDKSSANQQSSIESLKINPLASETTKNDIPGKDIANDLEIGKSPKPESRTELDKGLNETYIEQSPKPIAPTKTNVIDSKKESTVYEKADDVGKSGKIIKQNDEKDVGNKNNGVLKEEKKTEEPVRSKDTEKKKSSPLIQDVEKNKTGKTDNQAKDKIESQNSQDTKILEETKKKDDAKIKEEVKRKEDARVKEEARKKEELKKKEEARKKEEAKKKEELEKLKEKLKDN